MNSRRITSRVALVAVVAFVVSLVTPVVATGTAPPKTADKAAEDLVGLRTRSSKTFKNDDGSFTTKLYSGAVHYRVGKHWREIDSDLVPSSRASYAWENAANSFIARFAETLGDVGVELDVSGSDYQLVPLDPAPATASKRGSSVVYADAFPATDLRYDVTSDGVKETLVLKDERASNEFTFQLTDRGELKVEKQDDGGFVFFRGGEPVFAFARPVAIDARGGRTSDRAGDLTSDADLTVSRSGDGYVVSVSVSQEWLAEPGRKFPVELDPTMVIEPSSEDASFKANCATCLPSTDQFLYMGADSSTSWRAALRFDLAGLPAGANITSANLKLLFNQWCTITTTPICSNTSHQLDAHRMTAAWTTSSQTQDVQFDPNVIGSHTLATNPDRQWMTWDLTQTTRNWFLGTVANHGVLIKRDGEALGSNVVTGLGRRYAPEPALRPRLEVTWLSDGVTLRDPDTLHANGAELVWDRYSGPSGAAFDNYEVHRSKTPNFEPSAQTLIATIRDPNTTSFRDYTAAPNTAFTYEVVANGAGGNERTVSLPPAGQAVKVLQPGAEEGTATFLWDDPGATDCGNIGVEQWMWVGTRTDERMRSMLRFDVDGIPSDATISDAKLSVWNVEPPNFSTSVNLHPVTQEWQEGTGLYQCTGDGASWSEADGGVEWATPGGDFATSPAATVSKSPSVDPVWDRFNITSLVQDWVTGAQSNHGVLLKLDAETLAPGRTSTYYTDDHSVTPTLRPKLEVVYTEPSQAAGPDVHLTSPAPDETVSGEVLVAADAVDDGKVAQVDFLVDGSVAGTDDSRPFNMSWQTSSLTNGQHSLQVRATDDAGNVTTSAAVDLTIENSEPPTAAVAAPSWSEYPQDVLSDGPVGYWRLGDAATSTSAADASGNGHAGQYRSAQPGQSGGLIDDLDTAASFDNTTDVLLTDRDALDFGTGDFTIEALVRTNVNGERTIVGKFDGTAPNWRVTVTDDAGKEGRIRFNLDDGVTPRQHYGPALRVDDGLWHHVAVVADRDVGTKIYVDGVEGATSGVASSTVSNSAPMRIGDTVTYGGWIGDLDEVAVYNKALTAERVRSHRAAAFQLVSGSVALAAQASDDRQVEKVEFIVDGVPVAEDASPPYTASWNTLSSTSPAYDGVHSLTVRAHDDSDQVTESAAVNVTVVNAMTSKYDADITASDAAARDIADPSQPEPDGYNVTIANDGTSTWPANSIKLRAEWYTTAGAPVGPAAQPVSLTSDLQPGTSATVPVMVNPPTLGPSVSRSDYKLQFDLYDEQASTTFAAKGNPPSGATVAVEKRFGAESLGLEHYYHYLGGRVGAGMQHLVNVATGNSILRWSPMRSPGRGLSTMVDITYNGMEDRTESPLGSGFSLNISGLVRFGTALDIHPNSADTNAGRSNRWIAFTDGDGTTHRFEGQISNGTVYWKEPDGVHLFLREYSSTNPAKKWAITRPDRVTFYFDTQGYPTSVEDANGNRLLFKLQSVPANEDPGKPPAPGQGVPVQGTEQRKRIVAVTDAAGVSAQQDPDRTFFIDYYGMQNAPHALVRGRVKQIRDHTGSAINFDYYDDGNLQRITQAGGSTADGSPLADRSFTFSYTTSDGSGPALTDPQARKDPPDKVAPQSSHLFGVVDPRGNETKFAYFGPGAASTDWRLGSVTDRGQSTTSFSYDDTNRVTTVTAPMSRVTKFGWDTEGKVTQVTDPLNRVAKLTWVKRHVTKIEEPSADATPRYREFAYNENGYVTDVWDQLRNHTKLEYENLPVAGENGLADPREGSAFLQLLGRSIPHISQVTKKTNPKGMLTTSDVNDFRWLFVYDVKGNLKKTTDPANVDTLYDYNADGTAQKITDANTGETSFEYDANGLPTKVTYPEGQIARFRYNADGLAVWAQDPNHERFWNPTASFETAERSRTFFYYDSFHRLGRQSSPKSTAFREGTIIWRDTVYDANNNVVRQVAPDTTPGGGAVWRTDYDAMDRPVLQANPDRDDTPYTANPSDIRNFERTKLEYDAAGRMFRVTKPMGVETSADWDYATTYDFDGLDRPIRETRKVIDGGTTTTITTHSCYDIAGDLVAVVDPKVNQATVNCANLTAAEREHTMTFTYDKVHRRLTTQDQEGNLTKQKYDEHGNVKETTDAEGYATTREYDQRNQLVKVVEPLYNSLTRYTTAMFEYDQMGNLKRKISPRAWDARIVDPNSGEVTFRDFVTEFSYDKSNRMTRVALPFEQGVPQRCTANDSTTSTRCYTHNTYDPNGNVTSRSFPVSQATVTTGPDGMNNLPAKHKTVVDYFDPGWVHSTDDGFNRITYEYEEDGQQTLRTAPGKQQTLSYTPDNLLFEKSDADQQPITFQYNDNNLLEVARDRSGLVNSARPIKVRSFYDGFDRLQKTWDRTCSRDCSDSEETNSTPFSFTSYKYDLAGNVTERIDEGVETQSGTISDAGRRNVFTYSDAHRQLTHVDFGNGSGTGDDRRVQTTYYPTGREESRELEKKNDTGTAWRDLSPLQRTEWFYYANGKLKQLRTTTNITSTSSGTVLEDHQVRYLDADGIFVNGHRTKDIFTLKDKNAAGKCAAASCTFDYTYDALDHLVEEKKTYPTDASTTAYELDGSGNILKKTVGSAVSTYSYDGNRLTSSTSAGVTTKHLYDTLGRLDCITTTAHSGTTCPAPGASMLQDYTYDYLDRIRMYRTYSGGVRQDKASYEYDAFDRLVKETEYRDAASAAYRTYSFGHVGLTGMVADETITGTNAGTKSYSYDAYGHRTRMVNNPAAAGSATTGHTFGYDVHGSTSLLVNEVDGTASTYGYDPYGGANTGLTKGDPFDRNMTNSFRYTGKRADHVSGSLDMGARRFTPSSARFLQEDRLESAIGDVGLTSDPLTMNRFGLAGGNPLSYVEWDGHYPVPDGVGTAITTSGGSSRDGSDGSGGSSSDGSASAADFRKAEEATSTSGSSSSSSSFFDPDDYNSTRDLWTEERIDTRVAEYLIGGLQPPDDFPYEAVSVQDEDYPFLDKPRMVDPYGECSGPISTEIACGTHDYGYDLIRAGAFGDHPIQKNVAKDEIDDLLQGDVIAECKYVGGTACTAQGHVTDFFVSTFAGVVGDGPDKIKTCCGNFLDTYHPAPPGPSFTPEFTPEAPDHDFYCGPDTAFRFDDC